MEALERARIALRSHLKENKEAVSAELEKMRNKSKGVDIFSYVDKIAEKADELMNKQ